MSRHVFIALAFAASALNAQQPAKWRFVEEWRVGGSPIGAHSFIDVRGLGVFSDGRIVVLDAKDEQVHFLDPQGKPVRSVGRRGAGPGEFREANGLALSPAGEVIVNDPSNVRLTVLSTTGELVRTVQTQDWGYGFIWDGRFDVDGRLSEGILFRHKGDTVTSQGSRVWARDLARNDTVPLLLCPTGAPSDPAAYMYSYRTARGGGNASIPFVSPRVVAITGTDGFGWSGVWPDYATLQRRGSKTCDVSSTIRLAGAHVTVPKAARDSAVDRITAFFGRGGAPVPDLGKIPREYPAYDALTVDAANRLWVERPTPTGQRRFDVFAPTGAALATIDVPVRLTAYRPLVITNDHLYAFTSDADGLQYLVSLRIQKN